MPQTPERTSIYQHHFSGICASNPKSELKDFGQETTLHGLKYVFQSDKHLFEKLFWTTAFVLGIVAAGFLIHGVCISYMKNPVVVTYQVAETEINSIPFPAITICNTNRVKKSAADRIIRLAKSAASKMMLLEKEDAETMNSFTSSLRKLKCIDAICKHNPLYGSLENQSENNSLIGTKFLRSAFDNISYAPVEISDEEIEEFRHIVRHPCDEYALYCKWAGMEQNCSTFFSYMYTNEGHCCVFNKVPAASLNADLDNLYENAAAHRSWGQRFAKLNPLFDHDSSEETLLESIKQIRTQTNGGRYEGLTIVLNPQIEEYFCSELNGPGFVFKTHLPVDTPRILEQSYPISPGMEMSVVLTPSAIFADKDIKGFGIENRKCYFEGEHELKIFKTYTKENCIIECEAETVQKICGCPLFYMNLSGNKSCGIEDEICQGAAMRTVYSKPITQSCPHCLSTCNELTYIEDIVAAPISVKNSKYYTGYPRTFYEDWIIKNASILHVYFEHHSFYARERKQLYSLTDLIANIGGLLGLCLGFSGLSLVEMGYFCLIRPCFKKHSHIYQGEEVPDD